MHLPFLGVIFIYVHMKRINVTRNRFALFSLFSAVLFNPNPRQAWSPRLGCDSADSTLTVQCVWWDFKRQKTTSPIQKSGMNDCWCSSSALLWKPSILVLHDVQAQKLCNDIWCLFLFSPQKGNSFMCAATAHRALQYMGPATVWENAIRYPNHYLWLVFHPYSWNKQHLPI